VQSRLALSIRFQDKRIHRRQEIRPLEWLADNGIGLHGNLRRIWICAEHEDGHKSCSTVGSHVLDQLLSIHDRHHQVGHHQIGQGITHLSYRVATVSSLIHLVAAILQNQPKELPLNGNVVHDQYPFLHLLRTWRAALIKLDDRRRRRNFTWRLGASANADGRRGAQLDRTVGEQIGMDMPSAANSSIVRLMFWFTGSVSETKVQARTWTIVNRSSSSAWRYAK